METARSRGRKCGRLSLPSHKKREIKILYDEQKFTGEEIAKQTGVSSSTVYRLIKNNSTLMLKETPYFNKESLYYLKSNCFFHYK